jgi:hypothetical protein
VYWINLERSRGRRERMLLRFEGRGIAHVRVPAIDGRDEAATARLIRSRAKSSLEAAGIASHLLAMERALADGSDRFLVMEDDTTFEPFDAWPSGLSEVLAGLPPRFSAVALTVAERPRRLDALFRRSGLVLPLRKRSYWSVGAYLATGEGAATLLRRYKAGDGYDVTGFAGPHHAYEVIMRGWQALDLPGPFLSRIPLFLFEGDDSEIHPDHLWEHRLARDFLRAHFASLITGTYVSPFGARALLRRLARGLRLRHAD